MPVKDFEKLLGEAIDEGLSSLGESVKQTVYLHLEEAFSVHKSEITFNVASFTQAVEEIFGIDANDLEALILKRVYEKIGKRYEFSRQADSTFAEQVKLARSRLYTAFVSTIQSAVSVFYLENPADLKSFRLVAFNSKAAKVSGTTLEKVLDKTMAELYPAALDVRVQEMLSEVLRYGKPKDLGEFHYAGSSLVGRFSVAAFVLSSSCAGLVFKNATEYKPTTVTTQEVQGQADEAEDRMGGWRWEPEVVDPEVFFDKTRAREQWAKRKLSDGPRTAEFFSIRGKEYLEEGEYARAREFCLKAEDLFQRMNRMEEAFRNASLRMSAYFLEEKVRLPEVFNAAEEYFSRYREFFMHEDFVKNLAYYNQWKGYKCEQDHNLGESRRFHSEAEESFLILKQRKDAVFNASRSVLTYKNENRMQDFAESTQDFLQRHTEFSENKYYLEVLAHHYSYAADESDDIAMALGFRRQAERLFLEIDQRVFAFENACKLVGSYWDRISEDDQPVKKCLEETERFFEGYQDFSENAFYRKKLAEYYLRQAQTLASQLKQVLS